VYSVLHMSHPTYTLPWILPFVRQAMKPMGNLDYRTFYANLWMELEKAQVPGVVRPQFPAQEAFEYNQASHELRAVANEAFFYLFRNGYMTPEPSGGPLNHPNFNRYTITKRGSEWFSGSEPFPEEADGYMKFLHQLIQPLDPVIEQYVVEALTAFERRAYFAAAVMLGAASEKAIYLLADSISTALIDVNKQRKLRSVLDSRGLLKLLELVKDTIEFANAAKTLPYPQFESSVTHLMSMFEAIRVQRNDAVHPMNAIVSPESVRMQVQSFPYALSKSEDLRAWFTAHPNSI
jgi:hypothetical protein